MADFFASTTRFILDKDLITIKEILSYGFGIKFA